MSAECTCGAVGLPAGLHETFCSIVQVRLGRPTQAQVETARDAADRRAVAQARDLFGVDNPWTRGAA